MPWWAVVDEVVRGEIEEIEVIGIWREEKERERCDNAGLD